MPRRRLSALLGALALSSLAVTAPATASSGSTPSTPLVIGVDHIDQANQQPFPPYSRLFEYNDFFTRNVTVHQGDTIDFQTQAGAFHIIAFARNEAAARRCVEQFSSTSSRAPSAVETTSRSSARLWATTCSNSRRRSTRT